MSIFDNFFQKLFGRRNNNQPPYQDFPDYRQYGDRFRNPIWQTDDDDDDETGDFRQSSSGMHFNIFAEPFEMTRYFESQMDSMMKNFFNAFGQGNFGNAIEPFNDNGLYPALPAPPSKDLRDNFLKPGYEKPQTDSSAPKLDMDLDGRLSAADLTKAWQEPSVLEPMRPQQPSRAFFNSFGRSITSQMIRRPDGTMEQRQTITNSDGSTETTVTRQFGDKTHTIKTRRDKDGVEMKTEDLINMDENQLAEFENKWQPVEEPKFEPGTLNSFPWHKFFNFNPKL